MKLNIIAISIVFLFAFWRCNRSYNDPVLNKMAKINPNVEFGDPFLGYQDTLCDVVHYYYVDTTSAKYLKFGIRYHMDIQQYFLDHYILRWREGEFEYKYVYEGNDVFLFKKLDLATRSHNPYSQYYKRRHITE